MIPAIYHHASWRNTTPVDPKAKRIGICFDLDSDDELKIRLSLSLKSAIHLAENLQAYINSHSLMSSGMPSVPESTPPAGENVCPPATAATASTEHKQTMAMRFILCTPQGTGKSSHLDEIASLLGCSNVIEEWNGRDTIPDDTLAVTNGDYVLPVGAVAFSTAGNAGLGSLINLLQHQAA